jgi:hypothetical protein
VPRGFHEKDWRVTHRRRGHQVVFCARPSGSGGGGILPPKPRCAGGKLVLLKSLPPRWSCICPDGKERRRVGRHAYVCRVGSGGGSDHGNKACLTRGWHWTGTLCIRPDRHCPKGFIGKPPHCKKIEHPKHCPKGFVGEPAHCKKAEHPKHCPKGFTGKPPHCKKVGHKPNKALNDLKKALEKLKGGNKKH